MVHVRRWAVVGAVMGLALVGHADEPVRVVSDTDEPMATGPYAPTWESLRQYECPDWFRDAKFGIWAHWGPQCQPERGDWYARHMYDPDHWQGRYHREHYGHPSTFGFKDIIHQWKAEHWDPDALVAFYQRVGARYFFAMANHHDNFDLWNSRHQPWNSVNMGPRKDIIAGWARAARSRGLPFGVSVHAAHAWRWYETAQQADRSGPLAGVPYDGTLTRADGAGQWWQGYDPQDLYAQNHPLSRDSQRLGAIHGQWNWGNGAVVPDLAYCQRFYDRTVDLINQVRPDLLYFDDTALPLYPVSDAGLKIAAHYYNLSARDHGGRNQAVLFGKVLTPEQRQCLTWDVERGACNDIQPEPWQTDTCLGSWHYDRGLYERNAYKSAHTVIHMLVDIVSKNGNLLLSVPVRADGAIDEKERAILEDIGQWLDLNGEGIYETRPWTRFGEGPALADAAELQAQGFNEGKGRPMTYEDVRFTTKGTVLYAFLMGWPPDGRAVIPSLATGRVGVIRSVTLLGTTQPVRWRQQDDGLHVELPGPKPCEHAVTLKIAGAL